VSYVAYAPRYRRRQTPATITSLAPYTMGRRASNNTQQRQDIKWKDKECLVFGRQSGPRFISSSVVRQCFGHLVVITELDDLAFLQLVHRRTKTQLRDDDVTSLWSNSTKHREHTQWLLSGKWPGILYRVQEDLHRQPGPLHGSSSLLWCFERVRVKIQLHQHTTDIGWTLVQQQPAPLTN